MTGFQATYIFYRVLNFGQKLNRIFLDFHNTLSDHSVAVVELSS